MPAIRDDLKGLQGQLLEVGTVRAAFVRQEVTDALESFANRDQESLLELIERATAIINQARQREKAAEVFPAINPT